MTDAAQMTDEELIDRVISLAWALRNGARELAGNRDDGGHLRPDGVRVVAHHLGEASADLLAWAEERQNGRVVDSVVLHSDRRLPNTTGGG